MPLHGRAERPLMLDDPGMVDWAQEVFAGGSKEFPELLPDQWLKEVKDAGYDSVILADPHKRGDPHEVIFFEPTQLKSALGNRGTYDIDDPDLNKAQGGEVRAAKGGLLGALAKTAEKGLERAAKAVPVAQRAIVGAQEILPTAEREANLAKFLEESKVPKRVYHGTKSKQEIKSFDPSKIGSATDQGYLGRGFYFDDYLTANVYAGFNSTNPENSISGGSVYPVHLSIKNPVELKNRIEGRRQVDRELLAREFAGLPKSATADDLRAKFIEMGHDGVIFDNNGVKEYVAFEPTQIKSALGNRGTYDINDPDITKASGGEVRASKGGLLGALAKTAEKGLEAAAKGAKVAVKAAPQDEALRLAQLRAALPPAQGGLGLPANNTPMDRANAMEFNYVRRSRNPSGPFNDVNYAMFLEQTAFFWQRSMARPG
jgi:hypothetical protein